MKYAQGNIKDSQIRNRLIFHPSIMISNIIYKSILIKRTLRNFTKFPIKLYKFKKCLYDKTSNRVKTPKIKTLCLANRPLWPTKINSLDNC